MKRSIILPGLVTALVALSPAGLAFADNAHNGGSNTGQGTEPVTTIGLWSVSVTCSSCPGSSKRYWRRALSRETVEVVVINVVLPGKAGENHFVVTRRF